MDDRGQVGLGTAGLAAAAMVALVAASQGGLPGGILGSAEELGRQAGELGRDAAARLTPVLEVLHATGRVSKEGDRLVSLNATVRSMATESHLDLRAVALRLVDDDRERWAAWAAAPGAGAYVARAVRDADGSVGPESPRMTRGDLVSLDLDLGPGGSDFALPPRAEFRLELVPEGGAPTRLLLATPPTFGGATIVTLR